MPENPYASPPLPPDPPPRSRVSGRLTARFEVTDALVKASVHRNVRREMGSRRPMFWLWIVLILLGWFQIWAVSGQAWTSFPLVAFACIVIAVPWISARLTMAKARRRLGTFGPSQVEVDDGWFTERGELDSVGRRLEAVHAVERKGDLLFVDLDAGSNLAIPAHADFGDLDFAAFATELARRVDEARANASR